MTTQSSALVREVLDDYGDLAHLGLRRYLAGEREPATLYRMAADYPARGGRSLRASLCLAAARAFGATIDDALDSAVALELLHNAFLVHDDVEDESEQRRGRPALHVLHGVPTAVNVGDALTVLSLAPLMRNCTVLGARLGLRVLEETANMARESVEGQAMELAWRRDNVIDLVPEDYLRMILKKTCWYTTIYPCRVGALIGTRDGLDLERFIRFGFFLGAAFQIQDDLLNLVGDEALYGKELGGDLLEGKRTLMLIHLLQHTTPRTREEVRSLLALGRGERTPEHVAWLRECMVLHGSLDYARAVAHGLAGAAQHEASEVFRELPDSRDRRFLEALPSWMIERA